MRHPLLIRIHGERATDALLAPAAEAIHAGGVVGHPTETVYGLAVDPWNETAVSNLLALKGRRSRSGLILLVSSVGEARELLAPQSEILFDRLAAAFWPGPLSIVAPPGTRAPRAVLGETGGVAVRLSGDRVARRFVERTGHPVTSTSANVAGRAAAQSAEEIVREFGDRLAVVLDAGSRRSKAASTLVDLTRSEPAILREGPIARDAVVRILEEA